MEVITLDFSRTRNYNVERIKLLFLMSMEITHENLIRTRNSLFRVGKMSGCSHPAKAPVTS